MNIISASRRTDIPAFYSEWFMKRLCDGRAFYANPFSKSHHEVSLKAEDVHSIVFWTKDFQPMLQHLGELDDRGYHFTVLYTITGAPEVFEPNVPNVEKSIATYKILSERYSPKHITWRFDPILISSITFPSFWEKQFETIASQLQKNTERCIISFVNFYGKVQKNLGRMEEETGIEFCDPSLDEKKELLENLAAIGEQYGIKLYSCCDDSLTGEKITKSHCIDGELLSNLFPDKPAITKKNPTRTNCGCTISRDIGAYGTCRHMCAYCYANTSLKQVERNSALHDPEGEALLPMKSKEK